MRRLVMALVSAFTGAWLGCGHADVFRCEDDGQCQDGARQGVCAEAGYCAFEDDDCGSGLAYGELAGPELAGTCVPTAGGTGSSGEPGSEGATSSGGSLPVTGDESGPTDGCPAGAGGPCQPEDPCALAGICGADGTCVPTQVITCDAPPGPCHSPQGECLPDGGCAYPLLPSTTACEDGDPCTIGDQCDDAGTCVPGSMCPSEDPCQLGACAADGCAYAPAQDGSSCGAASAARCCGGACVDISSDPQHCGGCNTACAQNQECESIAVTIQCEDNPSDTSGRCRCLLALECPLGQTCRTGQPHPGRCEPGDGMQCAGVYVHQAGCPDYCAY